MRGHNLGRSELVGRGSGVLTGREEAKVVRKERESRLCDSDFELDRER